MLTGTVQWTAQERVIHGKPAAEAVPAELERIGAKRVLLLTTKSLTNSRLIRDVTTALGDRCVGRFAEISAHSPREAVIAGAALARELEADHLLAVGGGSVIDGTKFLSSAALYTGDSPWDILKKNIRTEKGLPFGCVLTLPATGSEMNSGAVITRAETKEKFSMGGPGLFPEFSILDPQVVKSIPKRQLANGVADAFSHVLEQYMTYPIGAGLQDRFAESIMQTLVEVAPRIIENPADYATAADFMWSCTMALNGLIQKGVPTDWAVHAMGHELTALYGIDHARTLAVIAPSHYRYNFESKKEKLAQYAERIWHITEGSLEEKAHAGIAKTEAFFQSLDIQTTLSEYTKDYEGTAEIIAKRFTERGWVGLGERRNLKPSDVEKIVVMSY